MKTYGDRRHHDGSLQYLLAKHRDQLQHEENVRRQHLKDEHKMDLNEERDSWKECYKQGDQPYLLAVYKEHKNESLHRYSRQVEQVLEYALYLESLLQEKAV